MNKKILTCVIILFFGASTPVALCSEIQTGSLAQSARVKIKDNRKGMSQRVHADKKYSIGLFFRQHSYKIAAVGLIGAAGIAAAYSFWCLKNQQEERRKAKKLYTEIVANLEPLKNIDHKKIQNILSEYSKKIQHKALFEQDKDGNTIIHHVMNVYKGITNNSDYVGNSLSLEQESPDVQTETAIKIIIQACDDNDMKIRLFNTRNNEGVSAFHAIYLQYSNKVRVWSHSTFLAVRMNKGVSESSGKRLRVKVEWENYKPTLVALQ